ncbi:hypothetical protein BDN67DRAFT_657032 [Paxillus ammoniavirescens]|nr:hypothetical protein BDN67DRAFT_657032 [Paxillus ammoniavirescens]
MCLGLATHLRGLPPALAAHLFLSQAKPSHTGAGQRFALSPICCVVTTRTPTRHRTNFPFVLRPRAFNTMNIFSEPYLSEPQRY